MMRVASYDIVFQEIPGEVTLALNLSGCPCHCKGCHSPHLWENVGEELTPELIDTLLTRYESLFTCVCFMGGDQSPDQVALLAEHVKRVNGALRTAWYSGRMKMPQVDGPFDYAKIGPYVEELGGLKSEKTNQRLYIRTAEEWVDITSSFWRKSL